MTSESRTLLSEEQTRCLLWFGVVPVHVLLLGWLACSMSPTSDEIAHLAAGVRIWTTGQFDLYPVNPPLVKSIAALPVILDPPRTDWSDVQSLPGSRPEWIVGRKFLEVNESRFRWDFVLARWVCIPLSVLGLVSCFYWSRGLFGSVAGLIAATLWCFSPNILGNAALITPDVAATALGVTTLFTFRNWLISPGWRLAASTGLLLGLTQLTKMTWLILYAVLPMLWLAGEFGRLRKAEAASSGTTWPVRSGQFVLMLFLSLEVLNGGYLFEGCLKPLGEFDFVSEALTGRPAGEIGNRFADTCISHFPVPLPEPYLLGLDLQWRDLEGRWRPLISYMRGERRPRGWWYYYLYCALVKVPLGVWLMAVATLAVSWKQKTALRSIDGIDQCVLLVPPLVLFAVVSSQTGFSRYFRYVLPCFPFAFVGLSSIWSIHGRPCGARMKTVSAIGLLCMIAASVAVYPHSLAFFNRLAGGPQQGHLHLLDSNLDWGQDLYALRNWQQNHPECRPLRVAYSGVADPVLFGFRPAQCVRQNLSTSNNSTFSQVEPGWYAVSANRLHGYDDPDGCWMQFLDRKPVDRAGYSILIYRVTAEED